MGVLSSLSKLGIGAPAVATVRNELEIPREVENRSRDGVEIPCKGGTEIRPEEGDSAR